ncbi:MAG: hypothetical protein M3Z32_13475 [Acidobacteriota bacterium]|nr:hypothetical protein [Acidobacteriota bacterium]
MIVDRIVTVGLCVLLAGCSTAPKQENQKSGAAATSASPGPPSKNPAARYVELVGFRVKEKGPGKLEIHFGVVNHSEADLGDLVLDVDLRTSNAKPGDPPLCSFPAKVGSVGPEELKQVTVVVPTKLRVYELPDWQFLKADFQITEPK